MKVAHVITRLIVGGAQENTLLTVEEQHRAWHDDVTLITGPPSAPKAASWNAPRPVDSPSSSSTNSAATSIPVATGNPTGG